MAATNLLIICDIDRTEFSKWRQALSDPLQVGKWVELPSFRRILLVFETVAQTQLAFDYIAQQHPEVHIFYGPSMPLEARPTYLSLPDAGRLWFISPPPSPPNGWASAEEEPPNTRTHFDDDFNSQLQQALLKYQAQLDGQGSSDVCVLHPGDDTVPKLQVEFADATAGAGAGAHAGALPKTAMPR